LGVTGVTVLRKKKKRGGNQRVKTPTWAPSKNWGDSCPKRRITTSVLGSELIRIKVKVYFKQEKDRGRTDEAIPNKVENGKGIPRHL